MVLTEIVLDSFSFRSLNALSSASCLGIEVKCDRCTRKHLKKPTCIIDDEPYLRNLVWMRWFLVMALVCIAWVINCRPYGD